MVSATRISLMAFSSSFIYFFPSQLLETPQSSALFTAMYDSAQFQTCNTSEYECLLQWQQNRSKAMMWLLYKTSRYSRVPKMLLLHSWLYVACYYPTTPTNYPSTTTGTSVGPPVAVNIDICGNLRFFGITCLNYMGTVRHWQPLWSIKSFCFIGQCWYFNPQY